MHHMFNTRAMYVWMVLTVNTVHFPELYYPVGFWNSDSVCGLLCTRWWTFWFHNMRGIYWLAEGFSRALDRAATGSAVISFSGLLYVLAGFLRLEVWGYFYITTRASVLCFDNWNKHWYCAPCVEQSLTFICLEGLVSRAYKWYKLAWNVGFWRVGTEPLSTHW
jgi:hypothetical protein